MTEEVHHRKGGGRAARQSTRKTSNALREPYLTRLIKPYEMVSEEGLQILENNADAILEEIGVEIRIAHYPPYCSKYNPIEHRLFPHVTRACQGVVFKSIEVVHDLIARTKTTTGLSVTVAIFEKVYQTGRKASDTFRQAMPIIFDDYLPKWNYRALPRPPLTTAI